MPEKALLQESYMLCYRKHEWFAIGKGNPPVFDTKIRRCIFGFSDAILTRFELVGNSIILNH